MNAYGLEPSRVVCHGRFVIPSVLVVVPHPALVLARWKLSSAVGGFTVRAAVPEAVPSVPVTVWGPVVVAEQDAPAQEPSGPIEKVVDEVTSPSELPEWSKPVAVNVWDMPAATDAVEGDRTR